MNLNDKIMIIKIMSNNKKKRQLYEGNVGQCWSKAGMRSATIAQFYTKCSFYNPPSRHCLPVASQLIFHLPGARRLIDSMPSPQNQITDIFIHCHCVVRHRGGGKPRNTCMM